MPQAKWISVGWLYLVAVVAIGCGNDSHLTWPVAFDTPDLTTIDRAKWDDYVGRIVQVEGQARYAKRGPILKLNDEHCIYIDGIDGWPDDSTQIVVTGNLVRHDDTALAKNGGQFITEVYYSLTHAKWSKKN